MAIADDISVAANGDIRYTGTTANYTVIEFHRFLQDLADDATAVNDDWLDITDTTPSDRSTDNIISLLPPYNIDDTLAEHLYDGSISQSGGATVYSGLVVVGSVESGTELEIIQNNKVLKNYWGTGINSDPAANILLRVMVKTRQNGIDIDGKRLRVQAREFGDTYAEFSLTAGLGNATAAIFTSNDLNNASDVPTVEGWTTITNTEGLRLLDISGDGTPEQYYSQWLLGSQTINDLYERAKWIQASSLVEDSNADTGSDFIIGDGTTEGQAQSFSVGINGKRITKVTVPIKKVGVPLGTLNAVLYAHTGTLGTSSLPTGPALATSVDLDVSTLTTSYQTLEISFHGDQQYLMSASTNYVIAFEYVGGDASNYVHVQGLSAAGTHSGNRSSYNGTIWSAAAADDLNFEVYTSPDIHNMSGELFRGITHSFAYDTESGAGFQEDEILAWGTTFDYNNEASGPFLIGEKLTFGTSGAVGTLLQLTDAGATGSMVVAIEPGTGTVVDTELITGFSSGATANVNGNIAGTSATGGTGQILALVDNGTDGSLYIQLLTGGAPINNLQLKGITTETTALVNGTVTSRTVSTVFIGQSTGSAIIGAYGIGIDPDDLTASDLVFDLGNNPITPPNNVTFTVFGLANGEDRVLVGPENGGNLNTSQLTGATGSNASGAGTWVVNETIPSDTPSSGTVRVFNGNTFDRVPYTSYTGSTFTLTGTLPNSGASHTLSFDNEASGPFVVGETLTFGGAGTAELLALEDNGLTGNMVIRMISGSAPIDNESISGGTSGATADVFGSPATVGGFISYIDLLASGSSASFTTVYSSDRPLYIRVRDGGVTPIKTFETTGTLQSAGGSTTAIRTSDL